MFTKKTLDKLLDEVIEEYFAEDTQMHGLGLWEVMEIVKVKYAREIETLED